MGRKKGCAIMPMKKRLFLLVLLVGVSLNFSCSKGGNIVGSDNNLLTPSTREENLSQELKETSEITTSIEESSVDTTADTDVILPEPEVEETVVSIKKAREDEEKVTFSIFVQNVSDLNAVIFYVRFDTSCVEYSGYQEGKFLGNAIFLADESTHEKGLILAGATHLGRRSVGVNGNGTLLSITFKKIGKGETFLKFGNASLKSFKLFEENIYTIPGVEWRDYL